VHNSTRKIGYAAHELMNQNYKNFPALGAGLTNFTITLYMFKRAPKNTIFYIIKMTAVF